MQQLLPVGRPEQRQHTSDTTCRVNAVSIQQKPKDRIWIVNAFASPSFKETVKQPARLKLLL